VAADSQWGYATTTLTDPGFGNSDWGYAHTALSDPPLAPESSAWGTASTTLRRPHHPVGVLTDDGIKYVPLLIWDGTDLR